MRAVETTRTALNSLSNHKNAFWRVVFFLLDLAARVSGLACWLARRKQTVPAARRCAATASSDSATFCKSLIDRRQKRRSVGLDLCWQSVLVALSEEADWLEFGVFFVLTAGFRH